VVDRARVDQLLALLARYVRILQGLARTPLNEFEADPRNYGSAERFLQLAIETTLAVGHHIVAAQGLDQPQTYAEVFTELGRKQVLDAEFAEALEPMARMRNRLVHVYEDVDRTLVHQLLQTRLGDFDRFAKEITAYLDALEAADEGEPQ
jgi:uncharacterized protein YutE (UPF0331/DUF86 family)